MLRIGLTGGIASGKTTVSKLFGELGIPVIDADEVSRSLVEPGQPALCAIAQALGLELINSDGTLNRERLRMRVFEDTAARQQLESLLHPLIYAAIDEAVRAITDRPYCIIAIPLLVETRQQDAVDRILLVDCPVELQRQRLTQRPGVDVSLMDKIIACQATREQRRDCADDIIDNTGDLVALKARVTQLDCQYRNRVDLP
ncbi:dephospho-CoA kinase [Candidatus Methylospira mobilis]|uniref:Dephospho-CoA kinase n=1 Tax=Candidatus Methylospira mobilis TaxID=1808979 RepID=A0A5Q0BQ74_9GAMM|nr:dephospho-CoA kinase [Candidatus Methylospira mobilis]QFY44354.1 dephospho-CoA kinase [Candidatus Methylospira mobilis]WNV06215.1 dephospho-CoA kinase [Candidatus Methylospira mobilis]